MQVFTTESVSPKERFAYWREAITRHFIHLSPETNQREDFSSSIRARTVAGHSLSRVCAGAQRIFRTRRDIALSPHDLLFVNLQVEGRGSYRQNGEEKALAPGDLFIIDAVTPFELGCPAPLGQISFKAPRSLFTPLLDNPHAAPGSMISGARLPGRLLGAYLLTMWRNADGLSQEDERAHVANLLDLVALGLCREKPRSNTLRRSIRAAQYARACNFIRDAASNPALTPMNVSQALGLPLRTLQAVFAEHENGVSREIQAARLSAAAHRLADASERNASVSKIAFEAGFNELSHFTRAFAARYGAPPARWRKTQARLHDNPPPSRGGPC